jgi:transposase
MSRRQLIERVVYGGWTYQQAADSGGVSRRTVAKWVQRFRAEGLAGLEDRSSRPRRTPHVTAADRVVHIRQLREQHPHIKPLGRFSQAGHRVHGDRRRRSRRAGWEYVHVAVDDHRRLAYVEVLSDQLGVTCAAFLQRAVGWFEARGVTVQRILTDNGSGWRPTASGFREQPLSGDLILEVGFDIAATESGWGELDGFIRVRASTLRAMTSLKREARNAELWRLFETEFRRRRPRTGFLVVL